MEDFFKLFFIVIFLELESFQKHYLVIFYLKTLKLFDQLFQNRNYFGILLYLYLQQVQYFSILDINILQGYLINLSFYQLRETFQHNLGWPFCFYLQNACSFYLLITFELVYTVQGHHLNLMKYLLNYSLLHLLHLRFLTRLHHHQINHQFS